MKKKTFALMAIVVICGILTFTIVSCSKTDQEKVITKGTLSHFSPSEEMVEPTIKTFIQHYKDYQAGYKSGGEGIKLCEAIWSIEAAVNYEFQSPKEELGNFISDSYIQMVDIYVDQENEYYLSEEDAFTLYSNIMSFAGNMVNSEDVDLYVADIAIRSIENGKAEMKVEVLAGGIDPIVDCNVNSTDYWKAANSAGKCDSYEYQYIGHDAASRINILLNCVQMNVGYWTDIENTGHITDYEDNNSNPCFWGMDDPGYYYECFYPIDIEYWLGQAEYVIDDLKPTGKEYINCSFTDDEWVGSGQVWFHRFENIRYGIPHSGGGQ